MRVGVVEFARGGCFNGEWNEKNEGTYICEIVVNGSAGSEAFNVDNRNKLLWMCG